LGGPESDWFEIKRSCGTWIVEKGVTMCGRFTITLDASIFQEELELGAMPQGWVSRYNVAPSQPVPVVTSEKDRKVEWMLWGLVPSWAKDPQIGQKMINARSETLLEKPSFRNAFQRRRCLILADGFFEWLRPAGKSGAAIPYYFRRKDMRPFAFAGLWEFWESSQGDQLLSTTIITCQPNSLVQKIHQRMPVILSDDNRWEWLKNHEKDKLQNMLVPYDENLLEGYEVSRLVNSPKKDQAEIIAPV
jgi:putative SOS response-associated peptidase YedK